MQHVEAFNITLVGANFPVQQVDLDDFDFGEAKPKMQFSLPQALQAAAGEFTLQILPDRFQIVALETAPNPDRIAILKAITYKFVELYTSKRSIIAIGHNFAGAFTSAIGTAHDFMKRIAWSNSFAEALRLPSDPNLSVSMSSKLNGEENLTVRLEPRATDKSRVFFDLNFNWGEIGKPIQLPVSEVIEGYSDSLEYAENLINRLAAFGAPNEGGQE